VGEGDRSDGMRSWSKLKPPEEGEPVFSKLMASRGEGIHNMNGELKDIREASRG